jgi:chromosome segregation ATPase
VIYAVLCVLTFLDGGEAERVGRTAYARERGDRAPLDAAALPPRIAGPLRTAREQAAGIRGAIATSGGAMQDVARDVDALVGAMETSARRAATLATTLDELAASGADPATLARRVGDLRRREPTPDVTALIADLEAQRAATIRLQGKLERFEVGQERICAALGTLRARIAEMSAAEEEAAQRELTAAARDLRERTDLLAESLAEVFAADDAGAGERLHTADDPRSVSPGA